MFGRDVSLRIFICDDHPLFRQGLRVMLEDFGNFVVVGEADRADGIVPAVRAARPDVVVLDIDLPDGSGIDVVERMQTEAPGMHVLMLSAFSEPSLVRGALRAGASGYVLKDAPFTEVVEAIRRVAAGQTTVSPAVAEELAASVRAESEEERMRRCLSTLTEREHAVLRLAAEGASNARIGKRLFITEGTVKNHMTHILRKLGVQDRTQAAVLATKHGHRLTRGRPRQPVGLS
jgi:DNA-binding NarL/FixJ family response regulator